MELLDSIVSRSFRDEESGRVVVFNGDLHNRGYTVKSDADELKIRSFLKMCYIADFSIALLGGQLAIAWSTFFSNLQSLGDPAKHLVRTGGIYVAISCLLVGFPYFVLWRSYKKGLLNFVSSQDEVLVSGKSAGRQPWIAIAVICLASLTLFTIMFYLIRAK